MAPLLQVEDLRVSFATDRGVVRAVDGVSFSLEPGQTLGIVGESGSGKSVTNLAIMGLLPTPPATVTATTMRYRDTDLMRATPAQYRALRGDRVAMIFQDPMTSLNPFLKISQQLTEVLEVHRKLSGKDARNTAIAMLERVGIPEAAGRIDAYPHQFSGGMRQRVMIAMSLLCEPDLLIADEPTTALDVTIQAQILELLVELQKERGMAIVLITHDLGVVAGATERLIVLYGGRVLESGPTEAVFADPRHPYTRGLLRSVPRLDGGSEPLYSIPGRPPILTADSKGCPFADRCEHTEARCREDFPTDSGTDDRTLHCWVAPEARHG